MLYVFDKCSMLGYLFRHLPFILIVATQMAYAYFFWLAYGTLAFVLGPLRTWSIILGIILWTQAISLPEKCLRYIDGSPDGFDSSHYIYSTCREASFVWTSKSASARYPVVTEAEESMNITPAWSKVSPFVHWNIVSYIFVLKCDFWDCQQST